MKKKKCKAELSRFELFIFETLFDVNAEDTQSSLQLEFIEYSLLIFLIEI